MVRTLFFVARMLAVQDSSSRPEYCKTERVPVTCPPPANLAFRKQVNVSREVNVSRSNTLVGKGMASHALCWPHYHGVVLG